jgi:anti-sigma factor RsiW
MSECRRVVPLLDAFVDGELVPERVLEVEEHLETCASCLEHSNLVEAMRNSTRRVVREAAIPTDAFRARIAGALAAERERDGERAAKDGAQTSPRSGWAASLPLVGLAAAVVLLVSGIGNKEDGRGSQAGATSPRAIASAAAEPLSVASTVEALLDELVKAHARPPEPQVTEPTLVERFEPEVGVPVHLPSLATYGARWEGGSILPMRDKHRAALLRYRLSNRPVTVYVYDARSVPLRAVLEPRVVRDVPIHVGAHRGYSIAAREQRGVGYAVATDLSGEESAELVAAIH